MNLALEQNNCKIVNNRMCGEPECDALQLPSASIKKYPQTTGIQTRKTCLSNKVNNKLSNGNLNTH